MFPENYKHAAESLPKPVAAVEIVKTKVRSAHKIKEPRPEIEALIKAGVLTVGEMVARSGFVKSTVFKIVKSFEKDGLITVVVDPCHIIPARHYWRG